MKNLLKETLVIIKNHNKSVDDVLFININRPSGDWIRKGEEGYIDPYSTDWNGFVEYASAYNRYDDGFGGAEVQDVFIVFKDNSWLERGEYDGSEWWEYKCTPKKIELLKKDNK